MSEQVGLTYVMYMDLDNRNQKVQDFFQRLINKAAKKKDDTDKPKFFWSDCQENTDEDGKLDTIEERMDTTVTFKDMLTEAPACVVRIPKSVQEICMKDDISRAEILEMKIKCPSSFM